MSISVLDIKSIVEKGGGLIIKANSFNVLDLKSIAEKAAKSGAKIIIKNPNSLNALDLKSIAQKGQGRIIFDFVE